MQYTSAFPLIECRKSGKSRHKRVYELLVDLSFLLLNSDKVIVLKERNGRQPIPSFPHQFQNLYFNTLLLQTVNPIETSLPANPKLRQGTGRNLATFLPPQHLHSNSKAQLCVLTQSAPKKKKKEEALLSLYHGTSTVTAAQHQQSSQNLSRMQACLWYEAMVYVQRFEMTSGSQVGQDQVLNA